MKTSIIILLFSFPALLFSQRINIDNPDRLKDIHLKLEANRIAPADIKLPFSKISLIDARNDTSKIGFYYQPDFLNPKTRAYKKISFKGGNANSIEKYFNDYYQNAFTENGFELLIVLKKTWISQLGIHKTTNLDRFSPDSYNGSLHIKWEYYLGKESQYLPIKRVDTAFEYSNELLNDIRNNFDEKMLYDFKFFLKGLIEIYDFSKALIAFETQPKKSMEDINAFNLKSKSFPILKDSIIRIGVFQNFEEFRNNRPSITNFKEKETKYGNSQKENYIVDATEKFITNFWAYYDGKKLKYGRYGTDRMYRIGNSFEFFGILEVFK